MVVVDVGFMILAWNSMRLHAYLGTVPLVAACRCRQNSIWTITWGSSARMDENDIDVFPVADKGRVSEILRSLKWWIPVEARTEGRILNTHQIKLNVYGV